jgi:ankyrin repeat protein
MRKFFPLLIGFLVLCLVNPASAQEAGGKPDSALIFAAGLGHTDTVQFLLEKGADVNPKRNDGGTRRP